MFDLRPAAASMTLLRFAAYSLGAFSSAVMTCAASDTFSSAPTEAPREKINLRAHLSSLTDCAAGVVNVATAIPIFRRAPSEIEGVAVEKLSTLEANREFVRNRACWAPVDLTPISACQLNPDPRRRVWTSRLGMTLISPRHVLMAKHNNITDTEVIFVSNENHQVRRKMIDAQPVETAAREENGRPVYADFYIGLLESDIDQAIDGVNFARILALDFAPSLRSGALAPFLSVMCTNQDREVRLLDWISAGRRGFGCDLFFSAPGEIGLGNFYKPARGGDSGSPIFTSINGQFVLLSVFHTPVQGSSMVALRTEIDAAMAALQQRHGGGHAYRLTEADCSGFDRPTR